MERSAVQRSLSWECFSTEESWAFGPPKAMKNRFSSATTLSGSATLPFVISTEAQRSGEICGSAALSWKCFSTEESWAFGPPKAMKNRFSSATTLSGSATLPFVISTEAQRSGEIYGSAALSWKCFSTEESWAFGPPKVMKNGLLFSNYSTWKHRPPLCHLDRSAARGEICGSAALSWECFSTEESWAFGPPKAMKNRFSSATTLSGSATLPFVISTEAQRSGEICGSAVPFLGMFFDRGVMGLRPTQGDEKPLLFSNYPLWKRHPPLCHLDRSAAQWRDLRFQRPFPGNVFRQRSHGLSAHPR